MSIPSYLAQLKFNEFLNLLFEMKQTGDLISWDTFTVASIGTVVITETRGGLKAYVITDVNFNKVTLVKATTGSYNAVQNALTKSSGFGGSFVATSTKVMIFSDLTLRVASAANQAQSKIQLSTVGIPTAGSNPDPTDVTIGGNQVFINDAAETWNVSPLAFTDTLTIGTTYYFYLAFLSAGTNLVTFLKTFNALIGCA